MEPPYTRTSRVRGRARAYKKSKRLFREFDKFLSRRPLWDEDLNGKLGARYTHLSLSLSRQSSCFTVARRERNRKRERLRERARGVNNNNVINYFYTVGTVNPRRISNAKRDVAGSKAIRDKDLRPIS